MSWGRGAPEDRVRVQLSAAGTSETSARAVVADLGLLHHSIAAKRSELASDVALAVPAVIDAVVALFAEAQDAIAANRAANTRLCFETRKRQAERGAEPLALGLEHHDLVHVPHAEPELSR